MGRVTHPHTPAPTYPPSAIEAVAPPRRERIPPIQRERTMNANRNDIQSQRRARLVAALGRLAFIAALLLSVVAGAGWENPPCCEDGAEQRTASIADARG